MSHSSIKPSPKSFLSPTASFVNPSSFQKVQRNDVPFQHSSASCIGPSSYYTGRRIYPCSHKNEIKHPFLRSLSSIYLDSPRGVKAPSRRRSSNDISDSVSKTDAHLSHRKGKAHVSCSQQRGGDKDGQEKNSIIVQGILKASKKHEGRGCAPQVQSTPQASPRVSFAHHKDGILKRCVSYYSVDSFSSDSCNYPSTSVDECYVSLKDNASFTEGSSLIRKISNIPQKSPSCQKTHVNVLNGSASSWPNQNVVLVQQQQNQSTSNPPTSPVPRHFTQRQRSQDEFAQVIGNEHHPLRESHLSNQRNEIRSASNYAIGEIARSTSDMIIDAYPEKGAAKASSLKNYDFAFIRRTDGSWTYAILVRRVFLTCDRKQENSKEEGMLFVVSERGCMKLIRRRYWADFIRLAVDKHASRDTGGKGNEARPKQDTEALKSLLQTNLSIHNECDENSCISF